MRARGMGIVVVTIGLLAVGCQRPFDDPPRGDGPGLEWEVGSNAPVWTVVFEQPRGTVYRLADPSTPAPYSCPGVGGTLGDLCTGLFQGTGFVVRVPQLCIDTALAAGAAAPALRLHVDDVIEHDAAYEPALTGARSALWVTVGSPGTVTLGAYATGFMAFGPTVFPTTVVARAPSHHVALDCAVGRYDDGTFAVDSFLGDIAEPAA